MFNVLRSKLTLIRCYVVQLYNRWQNARLQRLLLIEQKKVLLNEILQAQREWSTARAKMNAVESRDEIDYAIHYFEAAQKRYEMLLRKAKEQRIRASWDIR